MEQEATLINYVKMGHQAEFAALLDQNPNQIRAKHSSGKSLLLLATYYRQPTIVNELISRGCKPDIYDATAMGDYDGVLAHIKERPSAIFTRHEDGTSLLGLATFFGHENIVRLLLQHKADPNQPSSSRLKVCPIHSAVAHKNADLRESLVLALLKGGANPNIRQENDRTALHLAARLNQVKIATLLLDHGAETWARDTSDMTPEDIAIGKNHKDLIELFKQNRIACETEAFIDTQLLAAMQMGELGASSND